MAINVTFPTITFPHRGTVVRDEFVTAQETAQDALSGSFTTALGTFEAQANALELNVNAKEISANSSALNAASSESNAAISATQAQTAANLATAVVIPTATTYSYTQQDWRQSMMSKAEANAMAAERKNGGTRSGSGFDEMGKINAAQVSVNEGIWTIATLPNQFRIGRSATASGISKTNHPIASINGVNHSIKYLQGIADSDENNILLLPTAPIVLPSTATLTQQQIDSGVIKHADASNSGLIVNGKFDTDTSGWTAGNAATLSAVSGKLRVAYNGINFPYARQTYNTIIGKKYKLEVNNYVTIVNTSIDIFASDGATRLVPETNSGTSSYNSIEFTATTVTTIVELQSTAASTGYSEFDNIAVFPADAISRSDFVFLRKKVVDLSVNDFFYPLGNTQFLGTTSDAGTTVAGAFASSPTYSLFSDVWQADSALIGKGYVWSTLSDLNKKAVTVNPENNTYLDGDKVYQAQYGAKVEMMKGDTFTEATSFTALGYTVDTIDKGLYKHSDGSEAIGICLVHRRNQGMKHDTYNPNGTKLASDSLPWYSTTVSFTSIADCFTESKLLAASGYIGTTTGRADGLFYDQIHEGDITDLRNNSKGINDFTRIMDLYMGKLQGSTYRGTEGEKYTEAKVQTTTGTVATVEVNDGTKYPIGSTIYIYDLTASAIKGRFTVKSIATNTLTVDTAFAKLANNYLISGASSTRTKSNTLTMVDVIGNPANYPSTWKTQYTSLISLHTAEDGTSLLPTGTTGSDGLATYKLSRKANATPLQVLKSTDSGVTWTALTVATHYTFSTTTNAITFTATNIPLTTDLIRATYQTKTNMAVAAVNGEVIASGRAIAMNGSDMAHLGYALIGKVMTNTTSPYAQDGYGAWGYRIDPTTMKFSTTATEAPTHTAFTLGGGALGVPAFKTGMYITRSNGKAYLNLVFKEIKWSVANNSWGDDTVFNIVDNVSTTTDFFSQTILIGQKRVELPYFIEAKE